MSDNDKNKGSFKFQTSEGKSLDKSGSPSGDPKLQGTKTKPHTSSGKYATSKKENEPIRSDSVGNVETMQSSSSVLDAQGLTSDRGPEDGHMTEANTKPDDIDGATALPKDMTDGGEGTDSVDHQKLVESLERERDGQAERIKQLENEIKELKEENEHLRNNQNDSDPREVVKSPETERDGHVQKIEELEKEIKKLNEENEQLRRNQYDSLESLTTTMNKVATSFQMEVKHREEKDLAHNINVLQNLLEKVVGERSSLEFQYEESKKKLDHLQLQKVEIEEALKDEKRKTSELSASVEDLTSRLSKEMDTKISSRESTFENVNIKCRPMVIKDDFMMVTTDFWQEAKTDVDKFCDKEADRLQVLCELMLASYDVAKKEFDKLVGNISGLISMKQVDTDEGAHVEELPPNLFTELSNHLKRTSDKMPIEHLEKELASHFESIPQDSSTSTVEQLLQNQWPCIKDSEGVKKYISATCRLAWNMVIQRPAMEFKIDGIGDEYQEEVQEIGWGSDDPKSGETKVICYVYPKLLHGDHILAKGKVLLKKVEEKVENE